jgi:branched-chain amino acid transport system substrate-binding protein
MAHTGKDCLTGAEVAAERINSAGGIKAGEKKYLVEIAALDDQLKPDLTVTAVRRLLSQEVRVIVTFASGPSMAALELADKEGFLLLPLATAPDITARGVKLVVRVPTTSTYYASAMADALAILRPQIEKVGILWNTDPGSKVWGEIFGKTWMRNGRKVAVSEGINFRKTTDFYPILTRILLLKPEALLVITMDEPLSLVVKQSRELGYQGSFLAYEACGDKIADLAGKEIDGKYLGIKSFINLDSEKMAYMKEAYKRRAPGITPGSFGANGHEAVYLAALAMQKAGTVTDMAAVRQAVPLVVPFPESMRGIISFDEKGDNVSTFVLADFVKGKWVYLAKVYKEGPKAVIEYIK